jgi:Flp pilus assembly protein TadG
MANTPHQRGAILPFAALSFATLLGLAALTVDLGRLMVVRSELQSAADACALSAVSELNRTQGQLSRAEKSGQAAATKLGAVFQQATTGGNALTTTLTFASAINGSYVGANGVSTSNQAAAPYYRFSRCVVQHPGIGNILAQVIGASVSGTVSAAATATAVPSQRACVVPFVLEAGLQRTAPFGLAVNMVYYLNDPLLSLLGIQSQYFVRLIDLSDAQNLTQAQLITQTGSGVCDVNTAVRTNLNVITVGNTGLLSVNNDPDMIWPYWNARFGLYPGTNVTYTPSSSAPPPDLTGFSPNQPGPLATPLLRATENPIFTGNYSNNAGQRNATTNNNALPANYTTPNTTPNVNQAYGATGRRLIVLPIVANATSGNSNQRDVLAYGCALLYRPIGERNQNLALYKLSWAVEYLGLANAVDSPCRSWGTPGDVSNTASAAKGPLVPVLLQ